MKKALEVDVVASFIILHQAVKKSSNTPGVCIVLFSVAQIVTF